MGSQVGIARPTRAGLWQMTLDIEKKTGWPFLSAAALVHENLVLA